MNDFRIIFVLIGLGMVAVYGQRPEIVKDILPEIQRVGRTARLNCTVARLGPNSVQWAYTESMEYIISINREIKALNARKGGIPTYQVLRFDEGDHVTFQLVISRITQLLSGKYQCTVIVANVPSTDWPRKQGELIVQYPPVINPGSTTTVKMIKKGENATIHCDATSVPAPNITWVRSDGRLLPNGKALSRGKTMVIQYAEIEYAGVYRCVADNSIKPPAESLTQVYVFQTPRVNVLQDSVGQFPNGRLRSRLDCLVQGFPVPTVYWEFHDVNAVRRLRNSVKYTTTKQATDNQNLQNGEQWYTLQIENVQAGDMGDYYCVGENSEGKGSAVVKLFTTPDCQGAQCYSLRAERKGGGAEFIRLCPLTIFLAVCSSFILRFFLSYN